MFCVKCGKEISDGQKFCMSCGARIVRNQESAAQAWAPQPETPQSMMSREQQQGNGARQKKITWKRVLITFAAVFFIAWGLNIAKYLIRGWIIDRMTAKSFKQLEDALSDAAGSQQSAQEKAKELFGLPQGKDTQAIVMGPASEKSKEQIEASIVDGAMIVGATDEMEALIVPDPKAQSGDYLIRDGKYYWLGNAAQHIIPEKQYSYGYLRGYNADDPSSTEYRGEGFAWLYMGGVGHPDDMSDMTSYTRSISCGDVPVFSIGRQEKFVSYWTSDMSRIPEFELTPARFVGFCLPIERLYDNKDIHKYNEYGIVVLESNVPGSPITEFVRIDLRKNDLIVTDAYGAEVEDMYNLNYGEEYTVSWREGDQYRSMKMVANCRCYDTPRLTDKTFIEGSLSYDGFVVYDLSDVEPGLYAHDGLIFNLK